MQLPPVGCQLIVFGKKYNINNDIDAILDCLSKAGYAAVEGGPKDAISYRKKLEARNLVFGGGHVGFKALGDIKPIIEYIKILGAKDLCNSGFSSWEIMPLQNYLNDIKILNETGKQLRDEGINFHYHNHDFEFKKIDGNKNLMDILFEELDFDVIDLCVDVAWVMRGGENPAEYLKKHKDRISYLHFKDHDGKDWAELGNGKVDFGSIMKIMPELKKVRWVMIEQDESKLDPMESVTVSRNYLKNTFRY